MVERPLVSTITPSYRMGRYLKTFLEWLPRQTFFNRIEVVLDHNEPAPEEVQWVKDFQERYPGRIKHIVVDKVDPIGTSMNRCIRESTGEFLAIWNIDDLRTPDSLEQQATVLLDRPEIGIVYGNFTTVASFGSTEGERIRHEGIPAGELTRSMILGPFFMFRRSLLEKAGLFDEQLKQGPDFDLAVRLAFHGHAAMAPGWLGYYLNEGKGASTRPGTLQPVERVVIELRYGIYDKIDYRLVPRACRYNVSHVLISGEWRPVSEFVPDLEKFLAGRSERWLNAGLAGFFFRWTLDRTGVPAGFRRIKQRLLRKSAR